MVTKRTNCGEYLTRPSREVNAIMGFVIVHMAIRHGIQLHAAVTMSNHLHMTLTDPRGVLPAFMQDVMSQTARALNRLHGRTDSAWSSREYSAVLLESEDAFVRETCYVWSNPVKDGLVPELKQWPGFKTLPTSFEEPLVIRRPKQLKKTDTRPDVVRLQLAVPKFFAGLTPEEFAVKAQKFYAPKERKIRRHFLDMGKTFKGAAAVKRMRWDYRPKTAPDGGDINPRLAEADARHRVMMIRQLRYFNEAYAAARAKWLEGGDEPVRFPYGTYKMRNHPNVVIDEDPVPLWE